ncbi:DUF317 domain-containing protein [Streptomyces sp. C10-9-1]|uniref:DUF317 domain-containing protein n=1 Tax=Streptomyces sp. C10-9-1 TaxID=1859285 RepID=UPI003F4A1365
MPPAPETVEIDFITPRYLAGGGDPAWITVPLHRACGWSHGDDPLMPRVLLSSPDQKALLRLEPDPDGQWWTLHHAAEPDRPAWYATFGARTPVELIAAVTDALTGPAPAETASSPYEPLLAAGWQQARTHDGLTSPDGIADIEHFTETGSNSWFIEVAIGGDIEGQICKAHLSGPTPPHLVAAFTAALADPKPVHRTDSGRSLPTLDPKLVTRRTTDVLAVHVAGALEERVHSLAARRTAPPASPSCPPWSPPKSGRSR